MNKLRRIIFPAFGLFLVFLIYRFSFRAEFRLPEIMQILGNTLSDVLVSVCLFMFTGGLISSFVGNKSRMIGKTLTIVAVVASYFVAVLILQRLHYFFYWVTDQLTERMIVLFQSLSYQIFDSYLVLAFGLIFLGGYDYYLKWQRGKREMEVLENERKNAELSFLKAQINPHFIFNGLNNIHFLIDEGNAAARNLIRDFSDLLRYQLYEIGQETVPISGEIDYLKKYIAVQRIRKEEQFRVSMNVPEKIGEELEIAPLLLIIPVENAFKYAASGEGGYVLIEMEISDGLFQFKVENDVGSKAVSTPSGGLGIANLIRRLELIYGDDAQFEHGRRGDRYVSVLKIKIKSNDPTKVFDS